MRTEINYFELAKTAVSNYTARVFAGFFSKEDIEDLIIDTAMKMFEYRDSYDEARSALPTWASVIARSVVLTAAAKEQRRRKLFSSTPLDEYVNEDGDSYSFDPIASEQTDADIIAAETERIICGVATSVRDKRLLNDLIGELKPKEIAAIEKVEPSKIYAPLFHLRSRIRTHLDDAA